MRSRSDDDNVFGIQKPEVRRETPRGLSAQKNTTPDAAPHQNQRARRTTSRMQPGQKGDEREPESQTGGTRPAAQAHTSPPQPSEGASAHAMQRRSGARRALEGALEGGAGVERQPAEERQVNEEPGSGPPDTQSHRYRITSPGARNNGLAGQSGKTRTERNTAGKTSTGQRQANSKVP